jgi:hypothetical protein
MRQILGIQILGILILLACCSSCAARWPEQNVLEQPRSGISRSATQTLVVFNNGFHSGFYLKQEYVPFQMDLDSRLQGKTDGYFSSTASRSAIVEVGFSNKDWALYENRGWTKILRLLCVPDTGSILVTDLNAELYQMVKQRGRIWRLNITQEQFQEFFAELGRWVHPQGESFLGDFSGERAEFYESVYNYSMRSNCHDWTAYMLRHIGIPLKYRWYRTAARLSADLDEAIKEMQGH